MRGLHSRLRARRVARKSRCGGARASTVVREAGAGEQSSLPYIDKQHCVFASAELMDGTLPLLLPPQALPPPPNLSHIEWEPKRYLSPPQPPPQDDNKIQEQEMANARQVMDGKVLKKTRPRRTVDYNGGLCRWTLVRCSLPSMCALDDRGRSCASCGQILPMYRP